jgi:hypothetical protein
VIFGAGKLPQVMGDVAKGIKSFKAGLKSYDRILWMGVSGGRRILGFAETPLPKQRTDTPWNRIKLLSCESQVNSKRTR